MIDDANPIDNGPIDNGPSENRLGDTRPTTNREIDDDHVADDDLNEALGDNSDLDIEALRAADAAIDAEDAARVSGIVGTGAFGAKGLGAGANGLGAGLDPGIDLPPGLDEDVDEYADEFVAALERQTAAAEANAANGLNDAADAEAPKFYESTADLHALDDLTLADRPSVLERLGPAHFRSKGFSFMGFLQTVYDHVATEVKAKGDAVETPNEPTTEAAPEATEPPATPSQSDAPLNP